MQVLLGGTNNTWTAVFSASAKTLTISGVTGFELTDTALASIYDTTVAKAIPSNRVTVAMTRVAGKPVYTFSFFSLPSGVADADVLVIYINVPDSKYLLPQLQYSGSKI